MTQKYLTGTVINAGFKDSNTGIYYLSTDFIITFLVYFWAIFFIGVVTLYLILKSFKIGLKQK